MPSQGILLRELSEIDRPTKKQTDRRTDRVIVIILYTFGKKIVLVLIIGHTFADFIKIFLRMMNQSKIEEA